jgi:hypothetical protein
MADLTTLSWDRLDVDVIPRDQVSANFAVYELTRSETADRLAIDNSFPSPAELRSAVHLCRNVLQPVRDQFGRFSPNSVYRSQDLERAIKKKRRPWVSTSQHTKGQACDIEVAGIPTMDLARWVSENIDFDQLICECFNPVKGPNMSWTRVGVNMSTSMG